MRQAIFLLLLVALTACSDDGLTSPQVGFQSDDEFFPTVVPDLRPLYIAFEEEAALRGIDIDLTAEEVTGNIVQLGNNSTLGLCRRDVPGEPNRVAVDIEAWNNSSAAFREVIVFHELGHCVLGREHLDDQVDGVCISLMTSGLTGCEIILDDAQVRKEYLDELFR